MSNISEVDKKLEEILQHQESEIVAEVHNDILRRVRQGRLVSPIEWSPKHRVKAKRQIKSLLAETERKARVDEYWIRLFEAIFPAVLDTGVAMEKTNAAYKVAQLKSLESSKEKAIKTEREKLNGK